jgi:hypothetical protein
MFVPRNLAHEYRLKPTCKVFTSDFVLKQNGFAELVKQIRATKGNCRIKILGGSHSAFSVLYLLLNGQTKIALFEDYKRRSKTSTKK